MRVLVCFCTAPSSSVAAHLAEALVEERLAACVNAVSGVRSTYRWEGKVESEDEVLLVIKTSESKFERLKERLVELHPYDCPEVVAWPVTHGLAAYLSWVTQEVG